MAINLLIILYYLYFCARFKLSWRQAIQKRAIIKLYNKSTVTQNIEKFTT